jgi:uncharacterized protein (TIGR03086 family)
MEAFNFCERAVAHASEAIARVPPEHLTKPTPCTDWDVRALINHMIGGCRFYVAMLTGQTPAPNMGKWDWVGEDPSASFTAAGRALLDTARAPGTLEKPIQWYGAERPGAAAVETIAADLTSHTWDLLQAFGRGRSLDPELAGAALAVWQATMPSGAPRPEAAFRAAIPIAADAPVQDRLAAFLGRAP